MAQWESTYFVCIRPRFKSQHLQVRQDKIFLQNPGELLLVYTGSTELDRPVIWLCIM